MKFSFVDIRKRFVYAVILTVGLLGATHHAAAVDWHTNCFVPGKMKLLSAPIFPDTSELSLIGHGVLYSIPPYAANEWLVRVFGPVNSEAVATVLFFEDPISRCLSRVDLSRPVDDWKTRSFEVEHQLGANCQDNNLLRSVNLVGVFPCGQVKCQERHNTAFSFAGPVEDDDLIISNHFYFGGEFEINDAHRIWVQMSAPR